MGTQQPEALRLTEIARYCFRSEGMSDPPEQFESPTGDMVDYFDHVEIEKALLARITELESQLAQRFDAEDMATASAQGFRDGVASVSAQAADSVQEDAARYRRLADYLVGDLTDLDDEIVACKSVYDLSKVVDAAASKEKTP